MNSVKPDTEPTPEAEMPSETVVELYTDWTAHGLEVNIDGGWGIDALLGEQTRPHGDLDIAIPHEQVPKLRELLGARGFKQFPREGTRDCNFVLEDPDGHQIDVHSYTFDDNGNNIFGIEYEPRHLTGTGSIDGCQVKCISPEAMIEFHAGYELDEDDIRDVLAIHEKFGIPLLEEQKRYL